MKAAFFCFFRALLCGVPGLLALAGCQPGPPVAGGTLRARFFALLHTGDSVYARKDGFQDFARALTYYDSARTLADRSGDTLLLAEAVFAKGRIYDAWNKEPQRTIEHYQQAATLFGRLPGQRARYYYLRHLVAHAYDKVPDSLRTVQALRQLLRELRPLPDSVRGALPFVAELGLISTQVRNYALADTLLRELVRRPAVRNDPVTYNYLDHYYLTQARLDVHLRRRPATPYLDSLEGVFRRTRPLVERQYYSDQLATLLAEAGRLAPAYGYLRRNLSVTDSLNTGGSVADLRQSLVASERREGLARQLVLQTRTRFVGGLSAALAIISLLSFYLYRQGRRSRAQSRRLASMNRELDDKVAQVELLNKEIQHRVKNNLHMIFSLLQMQERRTDNEAVIEQLQAARLRVESIAALHNQLLAHPAAGLDLGTYLKTLVSAVVGCLANDKQVVTHLVTEELHLPTNSYFALSLILNEWVTNSIKYAGTAGGLLEVSVGVKNKPGQVCIEYFDNGPAGGPAPAGISSSGLGSQIITLLTRQLGATLHTRPTNAYHYELCLPAAPPNGS